MPYAQPILHIDFVKTFENKYKTVGYWFITSIFRPNAVVVWVKLSNGLWRCDVPRNTDPDEFNRIYATATLGPNGYAFAKGDLEVRLNQMVADYMTQNGIPSGHPYVYWGNHGDAEPY